MSQPLPDRFARIRTLGRGGMGEVFLVRDLVTGCERALKRLRADHVSDREDLAREFETLAAIRHPAVVQVFELGYGRDGSVWYTMEYVPGLRADEALGQGATEDLAFVAAEIANGLEALHAVGIQHGDLKPSNVIVVCAPHDEVSSQRAKPVSVRIVDFGLATRLGRPGRPHLGTAGYAAPEVVNGAAPSTASDLYGFGATLYHLLAGRPAFAGDTPGERLQRQVEGELSAWPLEDAGVPKALVALVRRLMAERPEERPRTAHEVRLEIENTLPGARRPLDQRLETFVLVGRERELAALESWASSGSSRMHLLHGEPGLGRSAILDAFAARSSLAGRSILRIDAGAAREGRTVASILRRYLATLTDGDHDATAPSLGEIEAPIASDLDVEIGEQLLESWHRVPAASRAVLLVDDGDQLEPSARVLLRSLVLDPSTQVRVIQSRPAGLSLSEDEQPLEIAGQLTSTELEPLDRGGLDQLISARLGQPAPSELVDHLFVHTNGHPGMALELLHSAARTGALEEREGVLVVNAASLPTLPAGDFLAARLARLDSAPVGARETALALAVLGGSASLEALSCLVHDSAGPGAEALASIGIVKKQREGSLGFTLPGLAAALLRQTDPVTLQSLHRAALTVKEDDPLARFTHLVGAGEPGEALAHAEKLWAAEPNRAPASIAAAVAEENGAGDPALWHERAAQVAWGRGQYNDVARHTERAITLDSESEHQAARWALLASARFRAGRLADVDRALEAGLALHSVDASRGRLLVTQSARKYAAGDLNAALVIAEEALGECVRAKDAEAEGHAALTAGSILLALDRVDEAHAMAERAADSYARSEQGLGRCRADLLRGLVLRRQGKARDAERAYQNALEQARASSSRLGIEESHYRLAQHFGDQGRGSECRQAYRAALRIALEDGRGGGVALATLNLAQFEGLSGRPHEAVRLARSAIELARAYMPAHECFAHRALAQGFRASGQMAMAQRSAEQALSLALKHASAEDLAWCRVELCRCLFQRGRLAEVGIVASQARKEDPAQWTPGDAVLEIILGRAALRDDDKPAAAAVLQRVGAWIESRNIPYVEAMLTLLHGESSLLAGRVARGGEQLTKALAKFESIPAPHDRAMALLDMARLASRPGVDGRVPAVDWLRQASELFGQLGDRRRRAQSIELEAEWLRRQLEQGPLDLDKGLLERVGELLHSLSNRGELTSQAMQLAVEQFDAERGVLLVEDEGTGKLEVVAQHGAEDATSEREAWLFSRKLVSRVVEEGTGVLVYDAPIDPRAATESVKTLNLRALLCVPMFRNGRVVGAVYLDSRKPGAFGNSDRRLLEGFAELMRAALESNRASEQLARENLALRQDMTARVRAGLIGSSRALQRIVPAIEQVAASRVTVLLTGETGTGKDLVARMIHQSSARSTGPYVSVNCGAISKDLFESELFGIEDRSATGVRRRQGCFQRAHRGTLFLDEIGEMPLTQQAGLLSVIDDHQVTLVGGDGPVAIDVRIIAATNSDLERMVEEGRFRRDLFHRLLVFPIEMPPLRERKGDIPELARHFAAQFAARDARTTPELAPDFLADIMRRDWPGNVRQLEHYIERVMVKTRHDVLHAEVSDEEVRRPRRGTLASPKRLLEEVNAFERRLLLDALRHNGGVQSRAARELGVTEPTLRNKLAKHGIVSRRKLRNL
jgi:transcriptional regulator with GAF, ATPase, and Fis domain